MNLFDLSLQRNIVDKNVVLNKIEKSKSLHIEPQKTKVSGPSLLNLIQNAKDSIEQYLGDKKDNYLLITNEFDLVHYFDKILENGTYAVDTETTGLNPMLDKIVGFSLYTPGMKAAYIPINHVSYITHEKLPNQMPAYVVKEQFDRVNKPEIKAIFANAKFDIRILKQNLNVIVHPYFDCILAARMLNENEPSNKLKDLYKKYILHGQEDAFTFAELFKGVTFDNVPPSIGYLYAARDAEVTWELYQFQLPFLTKDNSLCIKQELVDVASVFWDIEMPTIEVLADIENTGVMVDKSISDTLEDKYIPKMNEYEEKFNKLVKEHGIKQHYDISSSQQLAELFYDVLGLESPDKDKPRGTGKNILKQLKHPIVDAVKDYRSVSTLVNTFVKKLPTEINPNTGKIHCSYVQVGSDGGDDDGKAPVTGRLACKGPNMQQIPARGEGKEIRNMFCASPGYVLIGSDFSQQEPKLTAVLSNDEKLMTSAKNGGDVYSSVAAIAFNTTYENCLEFFPKGTPIKHNDKHEWEICDESVCEKLADGCTDTNYAGKGRRTQAKSIVLGITYGRGINSIAAQLGTTKENAQKIYDDVIATFTGLQDLKEQSEKMAKERGYVTTLWGRKRRLPDMQLDDYSISYKKAYSQAIGQTVVPEDIVEYYMNKLACCRRKSDVEAVKNEASENGIHITNNQGFIARAQRQCVNSRVQGSAADMTKLAMCKIAHDKRLNELGFRMLIQVHDEIIGEAPEENAKDAAERFAYVMSHAAEDKISIPFTSDVVIEHHWGLGD